MGNPKFIGTVTWFNTAKGYGFVTSESGQDLIVHYHSILVDGFKDLADGQRVEYTQIQSSKGLQAAEVIPIEADTVL